MPYCDYLTQFGVQPRYPKELFLTSADAEKAISYTLEIKDFNAFAKLMEEVMHK
jgi:hypothetical protein